MTIKVECACGKKLSVKDELAGRRVKCPACQQTFSVPKPSVQDETLDDKWGEQDPAEDLFLFDEEPTESSTESQDTTKPRANWKVSWDEDTPEDAPTGRNLGLLIGLSIGGVGLAMALAAWMLLPVKPADNVAGKPNDIAIREESSRKAVHPANGDPLNFKAGDGSGNSVDAVTPAFADREYVLSRLAAASPHGAASQIRDDANETAFAGMVSVERSVPWTKPDDLVLDDTFQSNEPPKDLSQVNAFTAGAIMFANGSIRHVHLQQGMDPKMFRALFTIAGGEPSPLSKLYPSNFKTIQPTYATPQEHVRHAEARTANKNSLKAIALAFQNYEQTFRHYPPATVNGPDGKPWHSWRVVILPFLGQGDLYEKYDASVPWDHPKNAAVLAQMPPDYRDPLTDTPDSNKTPYLLVTGAGTAFPTKATGIGVVTQLAATPDKPETTIPQPVANDRRQQMGQLLPGADTSQPAFLTPERRQQNLLADGSFEDGSANKWKASTWRENKLSGTIEGGAAKEGQKAAVLRSTVTDDAHFDQMVAIKPGTRYLLSGWIKTKDVAIDKKADQTYGKAGATLSIWGGYEHSRSIIGNSDWTYVTLIFDARDRTEVTVCARLGYWFSIAAGEAWFDDLNLISIGESPQRPTAQPPAATITTNKDWKGWPKDAPPPAIAPFNAEQAKQHQEAWAKHLGVPVEYTNSIGMKFRLIPPGDYLRGCSPEEISTGVKAIEPYWGQFLRSSGPQHKVIVTQPLYLGVYEVAQESYSQVMGNNPAHFAPTGAGRGLIAGKETGKFPVERVSWNDSVDFCVKLSEREQLKPCYSRAGEAVTLRIGNGYRLPTEAEWEFACRAGTTTNFWNGNSVEDYAQVGRHYLKKEQGRTHEVGELKSNPFGLFDIHGNVWEYAQDGWSPTTYRQFANAPAIDPSLLPSGSGMRPIRGGSWMDVPTTSTSGSRLANGPTNRDFINVGFRASLSVEAVKATLASPARAAAPLKIDDDQAVLTMKSETRGFTSVAFSPDGKRLVTGNIERAVKVWDAASGQEQFTMVGGFCAVFSPDGTRLVSAGPVNSVKIWNAATGQETLTLNGHTGDVRSVALSADGKRIASASADHFVKLWDATTGRELLTLKGHADDVRSVAFSPDGSQLASASKDLTIKIWDVARGAGAEARTLRGHTAEIRSVTFSPDGQRLASAGHDPIVRLWDVATGANIGQQGLHDSGVMGIAFSPDGKWLATAGCDQTLRITSVIGGQELVSLSGHTSQIVGVAWSPDGKRLASASYDKTLKVWDVSSHLSKPAQFFSRKPVTRAIPADEVPLAAEAAKTSRPLTNGTFVAGFTGWQSEGGASEFRHFPLPQSTETAVTTAGLNKDPITGRLYQCFQVPADATELRFSVHGGADSQSTYIALWEGTQQHHRIAARNDNAPFDVAWNVVPLRGKVVTLEVVDRSTFSWGFIGAHGFKVVTQQAAAATTGTRPVRVTQATQDDPLTVSLRGHDHAVLSVAVSPDGKSIASGDLYGSTLVWNVADRKLKFELPGTAGANIVGLAFSPDGKLIATGNGKSVKIWDATNGQELKALSGHTDLIWSVAFSPDSKRLASGSHDKSVKVWDIATGDEIKTLTGRDSAFLSVTFSPDGKWLAGSTSHGETYVMLWDTRDWKESHRLSPIYGQVWSIAFSPDSQRLVTASDSGRAVIWDVPSGDELLSLQDRRVQHGQDHMESYRDKQMKSVAFNHDGSRIVTAADSGLITIWDAKTGQKLHELSGHTKGARGAVFSPDGKWVASCGGDSLVKVWTLAGRPKAAGDGTIVKALVDPQKMKGEWEALQGTWRLSNGADFANQLPPELDLKNMHLVIKGETATVLIKNHVLGLFLTIDPTQSPKAFDMLFAEDIIGDSMSMGIYSLNRDALQIAWQPPANGRPMEFNVAPPPAKESPNQPQGFGVPPILKFERMKEPLARMDSVFDLTTWQKASRELNKLRVRVQLGKFEPLDLEEPEGPGYIGGIDLPLSETDGTVPADVWKAASSVNFIVCNVSGLTDGALRQLTTHRGLYGLGLSGKSSATKDGLGLLKALPRFEYVSLTEVPQTVGILTALAESSDLKIIEISGALPSAELLAAVARFKNLEVLSLAEIDLTDDILIELSKLPNLRKLSLPKSMKKLKRLEMSGHGIDNGKLHEINEQLRTRK